MSKQQTVRKPGEAQRSQEASGGKTFAGEASGGKTSAGEASGRKRASHTAPRPEVARRVNASVLLKTRPVASTACFGLHSRPADVPDVPVLLMSVPRRVLKRAVDRNTVRRLARETLLTTGRQASGCALLLRLKRMPTGFDALSQRARKAAWRAELSRLFSLGAGHA